MRATRVVLGGLVLGTALALLGCQTHKPNVKPTFVQELRVPPEEDVRYSQYVQYPEDKIGTNRVKHELTRFDPAKIPSRFGQSGAPTGGGF